MSGIRMLALAQRTDSPHVVGDWEPYSSQELTRVRQELRAAQRAQAPPKRTLATWGALGLLTSVIVLAATGPWWLVVLLPIVGLLAGVVVTLIKMRPAQLGPAWAWWRSWQQARSVLTHMLVRGLNDGWVVLADRVGADFSFPITLAVGPSGPWAIWIAEPTAPLVHASALAGWLAELTHDPGARAWVLVGPPYDHTAGGGIVAELRTSPVRYGPREVAAIAEQIELLTRPEPMEALAC